MSGPSVANYAVKVVPRRERHFSDSNLAYAKQQQIKSIITCVADNESPDECVRAAAPRVATARRRTSGGSSATTSAARQWGSAKPSKPIPEHVSRWPSTQARAGPFPEPADGRAPTFRRATCRSWGWHSRWFSSAAAAGPTTAAKWSSASRPASGNGGQTTRRSELRPSQRSPATAA